MRNGSLHWKLTASHLLLVVFSLAVAAAYLVPAAVQLQTEIFERGVIAQARMAAAILSRDEAVGMTLAQLDRVANGLAWRPEVYVGVVDADGRRPSDSRWAAAAGPVPPEVTAALRNAAAPVDVRYDPVLHDTRLYAAAPLLAGGRVVGAVQVSEPQMWVRAMVIRLWSALGTALLLGAAAAWLLGTWRARALSAPVRTLARTAERIAAGDLDSRAAVTSRDEIGHLAGAFNAMAAQLRQKLDALRGERAKLEAVVSSMSDAVVAADGTGRLLLINGAARDLLGLRPEDVGRPAAEALGDHPVWRALDLTARRGRDAAEEFPLPGGGGERLLHLNATPLRAADGEAAGAVAVLRDVTDLRRAERLRRELTANVSHELRTPLTSIKGFTETLLGGALADEATCRRFLTIIDGEATRLMTLVDDLMALSRLESRAEPMELRPVRLDTVVAEAAGRLRPQAARHGVALNARAAAETTVMADPDRLIQVLTNLIDNAIKFTPEGGWVDVALRDDGTDAMVSVSDSGRGIPQDDLPRVFDRFYRVERSRSREAGGTGLGLAIAKHIVEAHGGRIAVASRPGRGTTFTVALPLAVQVAHPAPDGVGPVASVTRPGS
jgi:two-component system, OmpR family, phosphate regulon sensor histidine kinase PhoR